MVAKKEWLKWTAMVFQGSHLQDQSEAMGLQSRPVLYMGITYRWDKLAHKYVAAEVR